MPDEHRRVATLQALDNHRRVVLVAGAAILEREHRCHALVAAALELCHQQLPARIIVPRAMDQSTGCSPTLVRSPNLRGLGVVGETLPIDHDARLVADDPHVVPRRHDREVAGPVLHLLAVVHHDLHPA